MNVETARAQMLKQQIRAWEVLDGRVLAVLSETPREHFVPEDYRELAFADTEIPLAHQQKMMAPKVEGRLLQALAIDSTDEVLEIGTGSGYLTACLARLGGHVMSVDIFSDLTAGAGERLAAHGVGNVNLDTADALTLEYENRFDAIAVTGSVPQLTEHFVHMLRPQGRLFIVVGRAPIMEARLIRMHSDGGWTQESLFETLLDPLINAEQPEPFVL
jgi:protein-L-isoaspartate(D-aspartate) O-methyltransferase